MSNTTVVPPIVSALVKAEDILGRDRVWAAVNAAQKEFRDEYFTRRDELGRYREAELRNWISRVAAELNKVLKDEGFDIQLDDFGPEEFGVVSILDVLVEWLETGERDTVYAAGDLEYPGVKFDATTPDGTVLFTAYRADGHAHPIVALPTKSGDRLLMTIADGPAEGLALARRINALRAGLTEDGTAYDSVLFPMVDLNDVTDISWLVGLSTRDESGRPFRIGQALQQTKFKMNQFGARVKSAVAMQFECFSVNVKPVIRINQPFFLWIERPGAQTAVMYGYLTPEDWKDPGDLTEM